MERKYSCFVCLFRAGDHGSQHGKNSLNRVLTPGSRCCLKGSRSGHTVLRRPSGHEPIETLGFHAGLSGREPCCLEKTGTRPPDGFLFSILLFDNLICKEGKRRRRSPGGFLAVRLRIKTDSGYICVSYTNHRDVCFGRPERASQCKVPVT